MNIKIKNNHNESIKLFARVNNIEKQLDISPGESVVVDEHETRIMIILKRRGLISISRLEERPEIKNPPINDEDESEVKVAKQALKIDTETCSDVIEANETVETLNKVPEVDKLQVVETEVEQYIEDGFIKGEWSEDEVKFLTREYPKNGRKYCATNLNRNETSVQKKVNSLGLKKRKKRKK